jgi:PAS domain S-box-containing protein
MTLSTTIFQLLISIVLCASFLCSSPAWALTAEKAHILVIHSGYRGSHWTDGVQSGIEKTFEKIDFKTELSTEYMDAEREPGDRLFNPLAELYAVKFEQMRPDVVISCGNTALAFLLKYREHLFPQVPVVFCGIERKDYEPSRFANRQGYTGVVEYLDLESTIDLIVRLQPDAGRIAVVCDPEKHSASFAEKEIIDSMAARYQERLRFLSPDGNLETASEGLVARVRKLDKNSAVFFLGSCRDSFSRSTGLEKMVQRISEASPVPVYAFREAFLGRGIVGGNLLSGQMHGRSVARKAIRVIRGEPVDQVPVDVVSSNRFRFDHRQLERFSIPESRLPEGSEVIYRPVSLIERNPAFLVWVMVFGLVLFLSLLLLKQNLHGRRYAKRLSQSEKKYRSLYDSLVDGVGESDLKGKIISCNKAYLDMTGHSLEEIQELRYQDLTPEKWRETDEKHIRQALERGYSDPYEKERLKKDGTAFPISIRIWSKNDENGRVVGFWGIIRDISERKQAQYALEKSERRFRAIYDAMPSLLALWDRSGDDFVLADVNPASVKISESRIEKYIGIKHSDFYRDAPQFAEAIERCHLHQMVVRMETDYTMRTTRKDKILNLRFVPIWPDSVMAVGEDVTEKKRAEDVLRMNEERLEFLLGLHAKKDLEKGELRTLALEEAVRLTGSEIGFFHVFEEDGRTLSANSYSKETMRDCSAEANKSTYSLEKAGNWADSIRLKKPVVCNDYRTSKNQKGLPKGHVPLIRHMNVPVLEDGEVVCVMGVGNKRVAYDDADVRQLKLFATSVWEIFKQIKLLEEKESLEQRLRREQRMESIGALAGGVAHEFNNVLGIVIGNAELALDDIPKDHPSRRYLDEIVGASVRAMDVVRQILRFLQKMPSDQSPVDITSVVRETIKLMRATIPKTIAIRRAFFCEFETIMANPTEISQLVINLCNNAAHAMGGEEGTLEVRLEPVNLFGQDAAVYEDLKPGNYVKLTVKDDGCGIEPDLLDRVFEPYFTTKEVDEGLGMGLAVAYGIVKNCDGTIKVFSEPGKGSTFEVLFPLIDLEVRAVGAGFNPAPTGSECILFIDDEASLVKTAVNLLRRLGYAVVGKTDALEALELFEAEPHRYDAVITDLAMPGMPGDRLVGEMLKIRKDLPVILCTGFSYRVDEKTARELGIRAFLNKPLLRSELARVVREVLDND